MFIFMLNKIQFNSMSSVKERSKWIQMKKSQ